MVVKRVEIYIDPKELRRVNHWLEQGRLPEFLCPPALDICAGSFCSNEVFRGNIGLKRNFRDEREESEYINYINKYNGYCAKVVNV